MAVRVQRLMFGTSAVAMAMMATTASAQVIPPTTPETGTELGTPASRDTLTPGPAGSDDIVVTGLRRSLETAQALKQNSDQIVDSVVAEDIGKLPDVTGAESLARVTGVQVDRSGGEAAGVRVRGLPDLTTTYNGREIFTAEGRSVALQDFPSASIGRIDVYKSASANLVEPGIAGLIDVRSRMPFDFKGDRFAGGLTGVHWYQSQKIGIDANLLASKRWKVGDGDMGLLIEGSYADINFLDSSRNVSQSILNRTGVPGTTGAIRYPSFVNIDYATAKRWRPSGHAAFQWRPSGRFELYLDALFQGFRGEGEGRNMNVASGPAATLSNITYFEGTNLVRSMTATGGGLTTGAQNAIIANTDTYQAGGGFIWKAGKLRVTGDAAFTDSTYTQRNLGLLYTLTTAPSRNFNFDTPDGAGGGTVTLNNYDLTNLANYRMTGFNDNGNRNHGRDIQARLDLEYSVAPQGLTKLQGGIRFNSRDADARNYTKTPRAGFTFPTNAFYTTLPLDFQAVPPGFKNDDATAILTWQTPVRQSIISNADALRQLAGLATGNSDFGNTVYTGNEKGYAGYLQAKYDVDIGMPIDGLIGFRTVRTEDKINGFATQTTTTGNMIVPINRENTYTDFLPNVSMRMRFTPEVQLRLAFTETRTRPGFGSLNPSLTIGLPSSTCVADPNAADCVRTASGGNPDLKPIESRNYDASLEYYFSKSGSATVGLFHRDLNGFINNTSTQIVDPQFGRLTINRPQNGGAGRISGVEAGFRTFFRADWLPAWARDFGVLGNYTYLDHQSELAQSLAVTLPGMQPLTGVSSHLANASLFYENRWVSLRAAYNYRSKFTVNYTQVADPALPNNALGPTLPVIEDGRGTLDISGTVNPTENISVNFSIANVLGAAATNDRQFNAAGQTYPFQVRFLETVYRLGTRFRF